MFANGQGRKLWWPPPLAGAGPSRFTLRPGATAFTIALLPAERETPPQRPGPCRGHAPEGSDSRAPAGPAHHPASPQGLQGIGALPALAASPRVGVWLTTAPAPFYYDPPRLGEGRRRNWPPTGINTLFPECWRPGSDVSTTGPLCTDRSRPCSKADASLDPDLVTSTSAAHPGGIEGDPLGRNMALMGKAGRLPSGAPSPGMGSAPAAGRPAPLYAMHGANLKTSAASRICGVCLNPPHPGCGAPVHSGPDRRKSAKAMQNVEASSSDEHFAWPVGTRLTTPTNQRPCSAKGPPPASEPRVITKQQKGNGSTAPPRPASTQACCGKTGRP